LITFYELLENRLATCDPLPIPTISEETQPEEELAQSLERSGSSTPYNSSSPSSTGPTAAEDEDNQEEEDREDSRKPMDHGLTAHNHKGRTDLHFVNDLIADVMKLHSTIERSHRARKEKKLTDTSKRLYHLHKNISERRGTPAQRACDQEEFTELQRELRMDAELLEAAKNTRIRNFYKSKNGKLNSVSFQSVKEKKTKGDEIETRFRSFENKLEF
jgi:hypothetical protein